MSISSTVAASVVFLLIPPNFRHSFFVQFSLLPQPEHSFNRKRDALHHPVLACLSLPTPLLLGLLSYSGVFISL